MNAALGNVGRTIVYTDPVDANPVNQTESLRDLVSDMRAGNVDLLVTLNATANVTANCTNHGGNLPPGQNPAPITVTGSQAIPASEIKNGNVSFSVTTNGPTTPIPGAPDCPNPNWSENITDLAFTSATITVEQPAGTVVLTVACRFSAPTANGAVSKQSVGCS